MSNEQSFDGDGFDWLIGRRIVKVEDAVAPADTYMETGGYLLTCDDGTQLLTYENEGCGGCGNGWSDLPDLSLLANHDNAITNVEAVYDKDETTFRLFIYYSDERFDVGSGDDGYGNGYYGGGFYLRVIKPVKEKNDEQ
ncbi:hypothetical protein FAM8407_01364 [Lacticaseibacillus paracasei]|uniref:DUF7448 domain-containing protein n=1 Tax=Lacticaseibacillus paracasei TaxID=1597 RepID=UPI000F0B9A75|nr:hypothetical protein [Lacticaseibacillus paracasei]RNE46462.1 hypothetical protein FAM8407_01364 [Lacticaseibacillus paracasei]WBM89783.1 hypothetical protein [Lacticaseibacillus phage P7.1]WNX21132.1 hypothetical protein RWA18_08515 [Lacticaseibacillus paracasei]